MSDNFIFQLSKELRYTKDGNPDCVTCSIEFEKPGMKYFDEISDLSQMVMNAMTSASKHAGQEVKEQPEETIVEKDKTPSVQEIKAILMMATKPRFKDIAKCFKLICLKTGKLDGEVKITELLISKLDPQDWTKLICSYISFFITPSLFSEME